MFKHSKMTYKMPYFNIETKIVSSVDRARIDYTEIMCICLDEDETSCQPDSVNWGGYKYSFKFQAQPTIEPVSYNLKGYQWNASVNYADIGIDIEEEVMSEVQQYIGILLERHPSNTEGFQSSVGVLPENILEDYKWNTYFNWALDDKIFWKTTRHEYKGEEYDPLYYPERACVSMSISSNIYIVQAQYSIISWDKDDIALPNTAA